MANPSSGSNSKSNSLEFGFFCFFFCKCLRASLGTKSNSMVHDKLELKFKFEIGPKLEPGVFFFFYKCL
jgi:hypothetical protein